MSFARARDDVGATGDEADAPAGHRERLGQAVQLDAAVERAGDLEQRRRAVAVEGDVRVGEVVHEQHVVLEREVDEALQILAGRGRRGRVVRERQDRDARARQRALVRVEDGVGERRGELRLDGRRTGEHGREEMDRVAGRRDDRRVARLDQHPHQVRERLLGADRRDDLGVGVERDVEAPLVELGERRAELRQAAADGVAVVHRAQRGLAQLLDGDRGRRDVGVAEAEVDHVASRVPQLALQLVDLREDVGRQRLDAANRNS